MHTLRWILPVALLLLVMPGSAQEISPDLQSQLDLLERYTVNARDLSLEQPVEHRFPSRAEAIAEIRQTTADALPPEEGQRLSDFYIAFDLLPPGSDYISLYLDTLEYQVAGFYDSESKVMNTLLINGGELGDELPLLEQITYVHEFTHALQDQHFDINALDASTRENRDQSLAFTSLVEGDATVVMNDYTQVLAARNPFGVALELLGQGIQAGALSLPPGLPDIMVSELLGYYTNGAAFVTTLYADGGWDEVDKAYVDLPQSSEQILHPDKYLSAEGPLPVDFVAPPLETGWSLIWDTTLGEFYLRHILAEQIPQAKARDAAAGWGGDHVQIYQQADTGALAWSLAVTWDGTADSQEFVNALNDYSAARYAGVDPQIDGHQTCWTSASDALCLLDHGGTQFLAYAPTLDMVESFLAAYNE